MGKYKDISGERFGSLVVLNSAGTNKHRAMTWNCQCDCGNKITIVGGSLRNGHATSCGCKKLKHGGTKTRLFTIWVSMRQRCNNKNNKKYPRYGGRGITVCQEWKNNFVLFRDWAVNNGYADGLSIERIDNDGNYEPSNCRWITMEEQSRNKSTNIKVGKLCLAEYCRDKKLNYDAILARISLGWSINRAITEPIRGHTNEM